MPDAPILKINDLAFELEQGFSDGYRNFIRPVYNLNYRSHPTKFIWDKGQFDPLDVRIQLAVGVQSIISSPGKLVQVLEKLYSYSLPLEQAIHKLPQVTMVSVGTWFSRLGYIQDLRVDFQGPWDVNTGAPMRAGVRFALLADFLTNEKYSDSRKLPNASNWSFKFTG